MGSRVEPDVILVDEEYGCTPEQTHASFFTVPVYTILKIRPFARKHQLRRMTRDHFSLATTRSQQFTEDGRS